MQRFASLDLAKNELRNARIQNLGAAPSSPVTGQIYYDTGTNKLMWYNGTGWIDATGGASVTYATPNLTLGTANAAGAATSLIRSDATIAIFDATAPTTSAVGDAAAVGTVFLAAHRDHVHGREGFGAVTAETAFGSASANGTATTDARSDHTHGNPAHTTALHQEMLATADLTDWPRVASLDLNSQKLTSLLDGVAATDGVNLGQVQNLINTGTNKTSVRGASTANLAVATALVNGLVHDGVTYATGERILLKNQTTGSENGIYNIVAAGAASRATDADISAEVKGGLSVWVNEGTANGDSRWVLTTNDPIVLGTTALTFTQDFAATATTAGAGLGASGNILSVNVDTTTIEINADTLRIAATAAGGGLVGGGASALAVGAGTGITVNADDVAINPTLVERHVVGALTGGATSEVITHNLGTRDVSVTFHNNSSPWEEVEFDNEATSTTTVTVRSDFANIPAGYRWKVSG